MAKTAESNNKQDQAGLVARVQALLAPLAQISLKGERRAVAGEDGMRQDVFTGRYRLHRGRREVEITAADLERLRAVVAGPATAADCRTALKPLRRLPVDPQVQDAAGALFALPKEDGGFVTITNALIEEIEGLYEELDRHA